jgi:hypothetical protein
MSDRPGHPSATIVPIIPLPRSLTLTRLTWMSSHTVIENAADRPELIGALADLRWYEMGPEPGLERRDDWVAATARESGRRLPATFAAVNATGDVVGGVGLAEHDLAEVLPQATPWIYQSCGWAVDQAATAAAADIRRGTVLVKTTT